VRFSRTTVITGYNVAVAGAMVVVVAGVAVGVLPIPVLLMLITIPLAVRVSRGLAPNYENPYGLMAIMGTNVQLHLRAGLLLLGAYAIVLIVGAVAPTVSLFLR
jgi:1,4-dihydroxy-2-naphthoate octaprenyltransferase